MRPRIGAREGDRPLDPAEDTARGAAGNVLLATFGVPFDERASSFAVTSAFEARSTLIVANFVELERMPLSAFMGYGDLVDPPELKEALLAPAALATSLGLRVERLRIRTVRRVQSLVEVAGEYAVALLVFGPDRSRISRRLCRKAETAVRDRLNCLLWAPPESLDPLDA